MRRLSAQVFLGVALTVAGSIMTDGSRALADQPEPLNAPLLKQVRPRAPATLLIERRDGGRTIVDLGPSIAIQGSPFAALQDWTVFADAKVAKDGTAVVWSKGQTTISAKTLLGIAAKQFKDREKAKGVSYPDE